MRRPVGTVPGQRTKTGRDHRTPRSAWAAEVLRASSKPTRGTGFVVPGKKPSRPLCNRAVLMVLKRMGRDDLTVHRFRGTFRGSAEERTTFAGSVAEAALGHVVGDKVEVA